MLFSTLLKRSRVRTPCTKGRLPRFARNDEVKGARNDEVKEARNEEGKQIPVRVETQGYFVHRLFQQPHSIRMTVSPADGVTRYLPADHC